LNLVFDLRTRRVLIRHTPRTSFPKPSTPPGNRTRVLRLRRPPCSPAHSQGKTKYPDLESK